MGQGLWNFIVALVGLVIIGAIIFKGLEFIEVNAKFKEIAKYAIGGSLAFALLLAFGGIFGFGGGFTIEPVQIIYFAITVIVILVAWYVLITWVLPLMVYWFPPLGGAVEGIKFVVSAVMLIVILLAAAALIFGAELGFNLPFRAGGFQQQRHGALPSHAAWASAGSVQDLRGHASEPGAAGPA
jgi:hypothetical protein